ncbi:MAG: SPOR domain-containing protein [Hyphomicrobiales bacterium]
MTARTYRLIWLGLFVTATSYLLALYLFAFPAQPEADRPVLVQSRKVPDAALVTGSLPAGQPSGLGALDAEVRWLKSAVADLRKRDESLQERVGLIEKAFGPATASIPRESGPPRPSTDMSVIGGASPGPGITVETQPLPRTGFGDDMMGKSPLPLAGQPEPTRTLFAVELATAPDPESAAKQWSALKQQHTVLLANLEPKVGKPEDPAGKGPLRLIAGPFTNAADASIACVRLRAAGASCAETVFSGDDF